MNFRSGVSSCASRPIEALVWINEIEPAESVADLKTSHSTHGQGCSGTSMFLIQR